MIRFENVTKRYRTRDGYRTVLDSVNFELPSRRNVGILGRNGSGKSTMTRLMSGSELPDEGRVTRKGHISFPIGFSMGFTPYLSGRENTVIVARFYGDDPVYVTRFVKEFAELGEYFDMPLATYSSGMRARLTFAAGIALDFDTYLIDEVIEVGDIKFREKCARAFAARLQHSNLYMISHNAETIRRYCDMAAVLHAGKITLFDDVNAAIRDQSCIQDEFGATG